jgi:large subunit ribosomal protein L22
MKNLRISPKKLRFLLQEIKKRKPVEVLDYLYYSPNKSAKVFYKAIKSAVANAKNTLKVDENLLQFKLLTVEEGQKLRRFRPGGRGTAKPFKRRFAHIKIILEAEKTKTAKGIKKVKEVKKTKENKVKSSVAKPAVRKTKKA